jgi:hypothetical protein
MSLSQSCWIKWIEENAENSAVLNAVAGYDLAQSQIKAMTISIDQPLNPEIIQAPDLPMHLGRWLGLFSMLEALEIHPCPFINKTANEQLRGEIQQRCHRLQLLKLPLSM